jgi:hypothetical protein
VASTYRPARSSICTTGQWFRPLPTGRAILFVYFLTMLSLPVFMWRRHRNSFSPLRHVVIPALGSATLIVPFVELCRPGQPAPYSPFPFIALALVAAAAVIGCVVVYRRPHAGAGEGAEFSGT